MHLARRIELGGMHLARRIEREGYALSTWKTPQNHTSGSVEISHLRAQGTLWEAEALDVQTGPAEAVTGR